MHPIIGLLPARNLAFILLLGTAAAHGAYKWFPGHYFRVGRAQDLNDFLDEKYPYDNILNSDDVAGVEATIMWKVIETSPGVYDFTMVDRTLAKVEEHGKKLILRIYDRAFWNACQGLDDPCPSWIPTSQLLQANGCVAQIWRDEVTDSYIRMMQAVAAKYDSDPRVSAIFMQESALDAQGADQQKKLTNFTRIVEALADAFDNTIVAPHLNYPTEYVNDLAGTIERELASKGIGLSTPDAVPAKSGLSIIGHMTRLSDKVPVLANMDGTFMGSDSPEKMYNMHVDIGSHYLVWAHWRSYDGRGIVDKTLAFLASGDRPLNTSCPSLIECGGGDIPARSPAARSTAIAGTEKAAPNSDAAWDIRGRRMNQLARPSIAPAIRIRMLGGKVFQITIQ